MAANPVLQILEEEGEFKFPFDVLDAIKLWPEELVPVRRIGKMMLNRNPPKFLRRNRAGRLPHRPP